MNRFQISAIAALLVCCTPSRLAVESDHRAARANWEAATGAGFTYRNTVDVGDIDDGEMSAALASFMRLSGAGAKEITLRIDSKGGGIFLGHRWGREIEDVKKAKRIHVTCIVDGSAYSMAAVILESTLCDERLATTRSTIMFHNGSGGVRGNAEDLKQAVAFLEALNMAMAVTVAARIGMPLEAYRSRVAHADWIMATPEALATGVIDGVISPASIAPAGG